MPTPKPMHVKPSPAACGVLAGGHPVPLEGVTVEATLRDFCTRVTITQRYRNRESHPIEAVYVFPLDESAAVAGFAAIVDGVEVVGEVMERDQAFEVYDDALAAGHGAFLLDQERPDVFTASLGNLAPGCEVLVRLTYVAELGLEGDDLRFVLPTTVAPRYAPDEDRKGVGRTPAEAVNPPVAWQVPYGLDLSLHVETRGTIRAIESPSHPIAIEIEGAGTGATVRLGERQTALDRDFVALVRLAEPHEPRAWVESSSHGLAVMVAFQPELESMTSSSSPSEIVFIVDRSGSMGGTSIAEAKGALQLCLRSLGPHTRFNIVGFGSRYEMLFAESREYEEDSLAEASRHVDTIEANLGGTEILGALEAVLSAPVREGVPRQVVLLTDGEVSNTDAVLALVRRHSDTTRVFAFGIGAGASHHLVRGVARAGEGTAEFIYPGERIEAKVMRQLKRVLAPAVAGVRVDWGGLRVRQAPYRVPPIFAGGRLLVYGFIEGSPEYDRYELRLQGTGPNGPVSFSMPLSLSSASSVSEHTDGVVATLAARAQLRDLEEGSSPFHDRRGSLQDRGISQDRTKEEAVRLGKAYSLVSRWTSYVAVAKRENPTTGKLELRRIPVALTRGWGGVDEPRIGAFFAVTGASGSASAPPFPLTETASFGAFRGRPAASITFARARRDDADVVRRAGRPWRLWRGSADGGARPLDALVRLQRADGSWELDRRLAKFLGIRLRRLEKKLEELTGDRELAARVWATALAIAWLERHASDARDEWSLLESKARAFLTRSDVRPVRGRDLSDEAEELVR